MVNSLKRILIRFNTKWSGGNDRWRVLIDGKEHLADKVNIDVPCETIQEQVDGQEKFHFLCLGNVVWNNDKARVI